MGRASTERYSSPESPLRTTISTEGRGDSPSSAELLDISGSAKENGPSPLAPAKFGSGLSFALGTRRRTGDLEVVEDKGDTEATALSFDGIGVEVLFSFSRGFVDGVTSC